MKGKIGLFIILLPFFASAQKGEIIDSLAKSKLTSLTDSWSLGISDTADMDIEVYNKYKLLFGSGATVQDDLSVFYQYAGYKKPGVYKPDGRQKSFDIYAHDVALAVLIKSIDTGSIVPVAAKDPAMRIFRLKRQVEFQRTGRYVLPDTFKDTVAGSRLLELKRDSLHRDALLNSNIQKNEDSVYKFNSDETLTVTMIFDRELNDMVITSITTVSNDIRCTNDEDRDGIIDSQDSLAKSPGDFTANGKPDYDLDGISDADDKCPSTFGSPQNKGCPVEYFYTKFAVDVFAGGQLGSVKLNLPETYQLGYVYTDSLSHNINAVDTSLSKKGHLKSPGLRVGFQAGGNFVFYFGQKERKSGISAAINYTRLSSGNYELTDSMIYTFRSVDANGDPYRRRITISRLTENIRYEVINVPVMFNYRWHPKGRPNTVIKLQAGPSLTMFRGSSDYNALINFEGIYQIDPKDRNHIVYDALFNPNADNNLYFTAESINKQSGDTSSARSVFQQLNSAGYDFAIGNNYKGIQNLEQRIAVAFNAGLDLQQKISEGLTIKAGVNFTYGSLFERKEEDRYIPIYKTTDSFRSVYYSTANSQYGMYGLTVGVVYNL